MPDAKLSALPTATSLSQADLLYVAKADDGTSRKMRGDTFFATGLANNVPPLPAAAAPAAADVFPIVQDAAAKKLTYSTLLAKIQADSAAASPAWPNVGPVSPYLFDVAGVAPVAAFSLRKLRSAYNGPCLKITRGADNQDFDVGFDENGLLDIEYIEALCLNEVVRVAYWYDQSGNGRDLIQGDNDRRLRVMRTNSQMCMSKGRPILMFEGGTNGQQVMSCLTSTLIREVSIVRNARPGQGPGAGDWQYIFGQAANTDDCNVRVSNDTASSYSVANSASWGNNGGVRVNDQNTLVFPPFRLHQVTAMRETAQNQTFSIGNQNVARAPVNTGVCEVIAWSAAQSAGDRTAVFNNQDAFWRLNNV
jgi:hypothetical protein